MSISNLKITPGDGKLSLSWTIGTTVGNAIIVKWRRSAAPVAWSQASAAELPASATSYQIGGVVDGTSYDVVVSQVRFEPGALSGTGTPLPPPSGMIVGLCESGWGPDTAATVAKTFKYVRVESGVESARDFIVAGGKVVLLEAGPYSTNGVGALNVANWAAATLNDYLAQAVGNVGNIPAVEVLNEPYGTWFWGSGARSAANAAAYAALVKATAIAFRNKFAGSGPKILAAYIDSAWWGAMVAAVPDIATYIDGVAVHPYGGTGDGASSALGNRTLVTSAHTTTGKPVWVTEIGWPTAVGKPATGDSLQWTEAQQAQNITDFITWAKATGYVAAVFVFQYSDYGSNNWYGIIRWGEGGTTQNGSQKPSYAALAALCSQGVAT